MDTRLIILVGKSASGKDTCAKRLEKQLSSTKLPVHCVISCTTRPPRENEKNDIDYHFVSKEWFIRNRALYNCFLETSEFRGWFYGTLKSEIKEEMINIAVLNPEGVKNVIKYLTDLPRETKVDIIYLTCPLGVRLYRSIKREHKFKFEYIRRIFSDLKTFIPFDEWVYYKSSSDFRYHDEYVHRYYRVAKIKDLPTDTICNRILNRVLMNTDEM